MTLPLFGTLDSFNLLPILMGVAFYLQQKLTPTQASADPQDLNCHFVICNGLGANDGFIQTTDRWNRQYAAASSWGTRNGRQPIRICVVSDGKNAFPTELQIKRTEALVDCLSRKFDIRPDAIRFPWH